MIEEAARPQSGIVISVRGSVVDAEFSNALPSVFSILRAGGDEKIVIEVMEQMDEQRVRGIALTATQGLARGAKVRDTGKPLQAPTGKTIISRMFNVLGDRHIRYRYVSRTRRRSQLNKANVANEASF